MTVRYKTQGFVFGRQDSTEADRIFSVFTKDFGRLEIAGKAIRKIDSKLKSGIDIFSISDIEFIQGKHRKTLTDAVAVKKFRAIYRNPEKLRCAQAMCQVADTFIKGQEQDEDILALLVDVFEKLDACQEQAEQYLLAYHYFFWNFVGVLGYGLNFSACAVCGKTLQPTGLYLSYHDGGLLCAACQVSKKGAAQISQDVVKLLRLVVKKDWIVLGKVAISASLHKSLKKVADDYRDYLTEKLS